MRDETRTGAMSVGVAGRLRVAAKVLAWMVAGMLLALLAAAASFFMTLKIARSSNEVRVPKLVGLSDGEAADRARELDLVLDIVQQRHDPEMPSGHILQQDPPPGTAVMRGRKVRLVLSLGGEVLRVPLLVGRADRTAGIELARGRLAPGEAAEAHLSDLAAGTIAAQVPQAGSPAVPGTRVHRLVSRGPEPLRWVMPDLSGRPVRLVEPWLAACGLRMGAVRRIEAGGRAPGTVLGQLPRAGYPVKAKDVVELTVAR